MGDLLHDIFKLEVHASLRAEALFYIPIGRLWGGGYELPITNSNMMAWLATAWATKLRDEEGMEEKAATETVSNRGPYPLPPKL